MSTILQFICCIIISFLVWFIFGIILLSPQFGLLGTDLFGPVNTPVSTIIIAASVTGLVQGSLMSILIIWQKSNTTLGYCFDSFIATEILLLLSMIIGFVVTYMRKPIFSGIPTTDYTYQDVFRMIFIVVFWYLVLSLIFLIPSTIIGFATRKVLNIANSKLLL